MKNLRSILAALAVLLMATAGHAQQTGVRATVPFNFVAGDRAYPAGEYVFSNRDVVLMITSAEEAKTEATLSQSCESLLPSADTKLVFDNIGGNYFLRQIWVEGNSRGRELRISHTEIQLAKNHPNDSVEPVIVAANFSH
jgi:hypothetical protein